jgi:threonylcarbamoyladenosine tRNA methylthiotransferase MtaB
LAERKNKINICTLGCKVNQYDTDAMLAILKSGGFEVGEGLDFADVYIVNTCAVTAEAERKSRQALSKISKINPRAEIYVCGCASQHDFSQFAKDGVAYISGTDGKLELARGLVRKLGSDVDKAEAEAFNKIVAPDFTISKTYEDNDGVISLRTRHFIKVQDGCDNFCSYCIVPYLRGRSRSRSAESILRELDGVKGTAKEVVITGINLSAYGKDIGLSLARLLEALKAYDFRIRLGSLEARVITPDFLDATKSLKRFCPHFHLSLQSGDDEVLVQMNRRYDTQSYSEAVKLIREYYPNAGITTDIIVGFPTETEAQFENSAAFAREVAFSDIHVFPYSSRKGTAAGKLKVLPFETVNERQKKMSEIKFELKRDFLLKQLKCEQEVLFEDKEDGMWCGHTPNYVKVYSLYGQHNRIDTVIPTALYSDGVRV